MPAKVSKRRAQYGPGSLGRHCGNCKAFVPPNACRKVLGEIEPGMWCKLWHSAAAALAKAEQ